MAENNPVVRSGRRLPSGRAVIGALLITLSVLAVLVVVRLAEDTSTQSVVVARRDLAPGVILAPDDLATVQLRLDESVDSVLSDATVAHGTVLLSPLARFDIVQQSNLADVVGDGDSGLAEVSFGVEPDRAPARLTAGELVSLVATFSDDDPPVTRLIADRVVVLSYERDEEFGAGDAVLRVGLDDGDTALAVIHAARTGELSVVGVMSAPSVVLPERNP